MLTVNKAVAIAVTMLTISMPALAPAQNTYTPNFTPDYTIALENWLATGQHLSSGAPPPVFDAGTGRRLLLWKPAITMREFTS